ncbi:MAG: metalloregulator ArsR/SmtB family transcription factor [Nitrososphaerales archaeon]|nr:metalloregulator ArsR/SmtB family transcription factor [Nitrososphaerales archaeon]
MVNEIESLLLARIEKTMPGRPSCEGMPPSAWVEELRQVVSEASKEGEASVLSQFFRALGDPVRVKIVTLLARKGELCACEVQAGIDQIQSLTSHHMNVLRRAHIIRARKEGRWMYYSLEEGMTELLLRARQILKVRNMDE